MVLVYVPMCGELIHHGHIKILNHARYLADQDVKVKGIVVVGLVSDEMIREYKGEPILNYDQRAQVITSLEQVNIISKVDQQPLFIDDILNLQPKYVVHGSDWANATHPLFVIRAKIIMIIGEWHGYLSEIPYTEGVSSTWIKEQIIARKQQQESQSYGEYWESYTSG